MKLRPLTIVAALAVLTPLALAGPPELRGALVSSSTSGARTDGASNITASSATVTGTANARRAGSAFFQWGTSAGYGSATPSRTIASGSGQVPVTATLTGLSSVSTYHYRLVVTDVKGSTSYGQDRTFVTLAGQSPTPSPTSTSPTSTTTTAPMPTPTSTTSTTSTTTTSTATSTTTPTSTTSTTPTATGTTSTPTSTTTTPAGSVCTNPYFTTSDSNGGVTDGGYYVHNNLWNASSYPGTKGTTQVCSFHSWNHIATASNTGDGAVKTYPNVHKDYSGRTISSFARLTSSYAATAPGVGIYNVAYDLWLNGVPNDEVMVWTDNHNQVPAGSRFASGVSLGGRAWDVYATSGNGYIAFVPSAGARYPSGTVDLKAMLTYLVGQGRVASASTVDQICYGVEVVDTAGSPATWNFTNFSITDS